MEPLVYLSLLIIVLALALAIVVRGFSDRVAKLKARVKELESSKQSLSTTYGRITEQWAPFMSGYPYDPRNFRFLGSPIDGVQFEQDKVIFVEFKANNSKLTPREVDVRKLIEAGKVEWMEFRLAERTVASATAPPPQTTMSSWGAERQP